MIKVHGIQSNRSSLSFVLTEKDDKIVFLDSDVTVSEFLIHLKTDGTVEQFSQMHPEIEKWRFEVLLHRLSEIFE